MKKLVGVLVGVLLAIVIATGAISGCGPTDADVASENLSKAAEQFKIERRIVFVNGITDKYLLAIEGLCSIEYDEEDIQLEVTCKANEGKDGFKKHYLGLSDNVTYFVEQLGYADVSTSHYRVIFKPEAIVPNIDRP